MVESQPSKLLVAGSIPVSRFYQARSGSKPTKLRSQADLSAVAASEASG
jgi:hypothetical protein